MLADKNPGAALSAYEQGHTRANATARAGGHAKPLNDSGLKPLASIPPTVKAKLDANERLMASLGLRATPAILWRDVNGQLDIRQGVPASAMAEVLGPR